MQVKLIHNQFHSVHTQANIFRIFCQYFQQNVHIDKFSWDKHRIVYQITLIKILQYHPLYTLKGCKDNKAREIWRLESTSKENKECAKTVLIQTLVAKKLTYLTTISVLMKQTNLLHNLNLSSDKWIKMANFEPTWTWYDYMNIKRLKWLGTNHTSWGTNRLGKKRSLIWFLDL